MTKNIHNWSDINLQERITEWQYYKPFLSTIIKYSNPGKILDLGCGLGGFVECCTRYGIDCIGFEGDNWAVEYAKKRYTMDIRQHFLGDPFPLEDSEISTIICNQVVEHISKSDSVKFFSECYRVLKDDGLLFLLSPCIYNKEARAEVTHINLYTPTRLKNQVIKAGFNDILPANYPLFIFGNSIFGKAIMGSLFAIFPFDRFSSTATLLAKKTTNKKLMVHSHLKFHLEKLLHW